MVDVRELGSLQLDGLREVANIGAGHAATATVLRLADAAYDAQHGPGTGMFGFLELEDDPEVMAALLGAAEGWLRARGMEVAVGPFDLTMNEEAGVLIEGFDGQPSIRFPWQPPSYQRLCESAGLEKAVDLLAWDLEVSQRENILPIMFELDRQAREEHPFRRVEQLEAPVDRVAQGMVTPRLVPRPAGEKVETPREARNTKPNARSKMLWLAMPSRTASA